MRKIREFVLEHFEGSLIILIFIGILATAFLVYYKFSFLNFFFLPVILSAYFLGMRRAILTAVFCIVWVILYLFFFNLFRGLKLELSLDEIITLVSWGSFLVLTAALIGKISEQREDRIKSLKSSYIAMLKVVLKYLEVADEKKPRSLRVSLLSGKIARTAGLSTTEVENIKSAALLYEAGDLRASLPLFENVADFMKSDMKVSKTQTVDREQLMLSTTASLLKTIEPLLSGCFHHYVKEADKPDKNLDEIPLGSSIIALADLYDRLSTQTPSQAGEEINPLEEIEKLSGRSFPVPFVRALREVVRAP